MRHFREAFCARFGAENALAIETAANSHQNGVHDRVGSDRFRWALLICIGYKCLQKFSKRHEITCSWDEVKPWLMEHSEYLLAHDGDVDYLALFCGTYNFLEGDDIVNPNT